MSLCEASGHEGPLHECSIYESIEAGKLLADMLKLGRSQPWPKALATVVGGKGQLSGAGILQYFQPLMDWLKEETSGGKGCGWNTSL